MSHNCPYWCPLEHFGFLVALTHTHYLLGPAYLSVSVQRDKKNEKVMSELIRQCFCNIMLRASCHYKGAEKKPRTELGQMLLEECHCWRKTTLMSYTSMLLIWNECHGDLVSVSWFLLGTGWFQKETKD